MLELLVSAGALGLFAILVHSMLVLGHSFTKSQRHFFDFLQTTRVIKQKMCMSNASFKSINLDLFNSYRRKKVTVIVKLDGNNIPYNVYSREYEKLDSTSPTTITPPPPGCNIFPDCPPTLPADPSCPTPPHSHPPSHLSSTPPHPHFSDPHSHPDPDPHFPPPTNPIMGLQIVDIALDPAFKDAIVNPVIQSNDVVKGTDDKPYYYKVYQDSHTIVKMHFDSSTISTSGGFLSGYIFASRCVENKPHSIHTNSDGHNFTFNPEAKKKSALYILKSLDRRPYYFPSTESNEYEVQCCLKGEDPNTCESANEGWVPRIYVIHLKPIDEIPTPPTPPSVYSKSCYGFSGQVTYIQELPEAQDLNNIWGMGFMLSMNAKATFSQAGFQLDTMFLKNTCSTSVVSVQKCQSLSLGINPSSQSLHGVASSMIDYIIPDISSCAGYSSGVDTTSLIGL